MWEYSGRKWIGARDLLVHSLKTYIVIDTPNKPNQTIILSFLPGYKPVITACTWIWPLAHWAPAEKLFLFFLDKHTGHRVYPKGSNAIFFKIAGECWGYNASSFGKSLQRHTEYPWWDNIFMQFTAIEGSWEQLDLDNSKKHVHKLKLCEPYPK